MSKGGSTSTDVTIPDYLKSPIIRNLNRAEQVARQGYTPYYGPDVAAQTPLQEAAIINSGQAANAFGLGSGNIDPMLGMPEAQTYADGVRGYSSGTLFDQALDTLKTNRPDQYANIEGMFNPTGAANYNGGTTGGFGTGAANYDGGYGGDYGDGGTQTNSNAGVNDYLAAGAGLAGLYGASKGLPAVKNAIGGLLSKTPLQPPLNPLNTFYQGATNIAGTGGLGTGGGTGMLGGLGALPTMAQVINPILPMAAAVAAVKPFGDYIVKPFARDVMGFGNETDKRREQLATFGRESGLDDYKSAMAGGGDYSSYIESLRPPTSPFQAEINSIGDAGDRQYEEEQVVDMFQTPQGQQEMSNYYANNPEFFNLDGSPSASVLAEQQRGMDVVSQYIRPTMNRDDYSLLGSGFRQTRN